MKKKQNASTNAFVIGEDEMHKQNEANSNGVIQVRVKYQNMQFYNRNELNNKDHSLSMKNFLFKTKQLKKYARVDSKNEQRQRYFKRFFNYQGARNNPIIKAMITKKKKPSQKMKPHICSYNKHAFNKSSILPYSYMNHENNVNSNILSHNLFNNNSTKQLHSSISYSTYDVNDRQLKLLNSNNSDSNINNNDNKRKSPAFSMEYNSKIQLQPFQSNHNTSKENNISTSNMLQSKVHNSKEKETAVRPIKPNGKLPFPIKQLKIPTLYKKPKNTQINEYNCSLYCQYYSKKASSLKDKHSQETTTKCALFDHMKHDQKGNIARNRPRTSLDNANQIH